MDGIVWPVPQDGPVPMEGVVYAHPLEDGRTAAAATGATATGTASTAATAVTGTGAAAEAGTDAFGGGSVGVATPRTTRVAATGAAAVTRGRQLRAASTRPRSNSR
ncbi:hypothetical protein I4F81_010040 [Pyropia yezoensis]|uniref:Uncharacterized protein n=1 Tax=Pyropia yezoensis TaxID=2788 RepID=A0ACC3CBT9_PYRYE|nr:hypothetical protein I4F81_010040 [Neopyropia yezoensis]